MMQRERMPEKILWFVSTTEDTHFLKAFSEQIEGQIDVVHLNFITRLDLMGFKGNHYFPFSRYQNNEIQADISKTFNVLSERLTLAEADIAYRSTYGLLEKLVSQVQDHLFMIPSGRHVHHVAATAFAKEKNIKRLYINYSNFPGYTFFDPEGTDCLASIFHDPARLDRLYPEPVDVDAIFQKFADLKRNQKAIPQAASSKLKTKIKRLAFVADTMAQRLFGLVGDRRIKIGGAPVDTDDYQLKYDKVSLNSPFIFFPMQVSTDQQVLVNYDGGSVIAALKQALALAEEKGVDLYVREHPAEARKSYVRREMDKVRSSNSRLKIVTSSVSELIDGSIGVVTINSTVGLECRINRKPVWFLGNSFYQKTNDRQLALYLDRYLVSVDYHNPEYISKVKYALCIVLSDSV